VERTSIYLAVINICIFRTKNCECVQREREKEKERCCIFLSVCGERERDKVYRLQLLLAICKTVLVVSEPLLHNFTRHKALKVNTDWN
jgi:hypothetical protein